MMSRKRIGIKKKKKNVEDGWGGETQTELCNTLYM